MSNTDSNSGECNKDLNLIPADLRDIIDGLWGAFNWEASPQGHDYWTDVITQLETLLKDSQTKE